MVQANSINYYSPAKWVVSTVAGEGTHTTVSGALTSSSSGDTIFIMPGTYTENLTLKAGVNLAAYVGDSLTPTVTIVGKATFTAAGTVTISCIRLQTNSDFFLAVTGSAASLVNLENCYLNCSNNTGISFTTSSSSAAIFVIDSFGDIATTGIAIYSHSSAGTLKMFYTRISNTGGSTTASSNSAGSVNLNWTSIFSPVSTTSTGGIGLSFSDINTSSQNATCLTHGGSGSSGSFKSQYTSGSASAISIGAGATLPCTHNTVNSTNTNAITGAGAVQYGTIDFTGTSSTINTTTQTALVTRFGRNQSSLQPAFAAYLGSNLANQTGAGAVYTLGTTTALTEIFDQNSDFNTNGTFTAPVTGRYDLNFNIVFNGCTVATTIVSGFVTSNRNWYGYFMRPAGTSDITTQLSHLVDMDAADTAVVTASITGEAGNTDDVVGQADIYTGFSGSLQF